MFVQYVCSGGMGLLRVTMLLFGSFSGQCTKIMSIPIFLWTNCKTKKIGQITNIKHLAAFNVNYNNNYNNPYKALKRQIIDTIFIIDRSQKFSIFMDCPSIYTLLITYGLTAGRPPDQLFCMEEANSSKALNEIDVMCCLLHFFW